MSDERLDVDLVVNGRRVSPVPGWDDLRSLMLGARSTGS